MTGVIGSGINSMICCSFFVSFLAYKDDASKTATIYSTAATVATDSAATATVFVKKVAVN
jgi:hypothetical protein